MRSSASALVADGPGPGRGLGVGHGHGERVILGVRPRLLVRRPRYRHRLAGDLEVVHQLGPGPDRRALPGLRGVLHQLVEPRVGLAVPVAFYPHSARSWGTRRMWTCRGGVHDPPAQGGPQGANKWLLKPPGRSLARPGRPRECRPWHIDPNLWGTNGHFNHIFAPVPARAGDPLSSRWSRRRGGG